MQYFGFNFGVPADIIFYFHFVKLGKFDEILPEPLLSTLQKLHLDLYYSHKTYFIVLCVLEDPLSSSNAVIEIGLANFKHLGHLYYNLSRLTIIENIS